MRRALPAVAATLALYLAPYAPAQLVPGGAAPAQAASGASASLTDQVSPALPKAPTSLQIRTGKSGKATAGDIIILTVKPPAGQGEGAEIFVAQKLKEEPVEWGEGRILWWTPYDAQSGAIVVALTTYKPGNFEIKPIAFAKGGAHLFASEPQSVEFSSVGGDKSKDDIYPPVGGALPAWVWILLGLLALGLVLGALYWLNEWNKKRKAKVEALARAPRVLLPNEEFEKTRRETEAKGHVDRGNYKSHYFALSDAAKRFLGKAYRFDAEEKTTRELMRELENLGLSDNLIDQWEIVFDEMDIVKFTDQLPERETARGLGERLSQLVTVSYSNSPVAREEAQRKMAESRKGGAR